MYYTIFQLPTENDNAFMNHRFAEAHGGVKIHDYESIYTGYIAGNDPVEVLEKIYIKFNLNHPSDYKGRSLSVSDLVALEDTGTYFCDSFGWKKIN